MINVLTTVKEKKQTKSDRPVYVKGGGREEYVYACIHVLVHAPNTLEGHQEAAPSFAG